MIKNNTYDAVIIGGGFYGAVIAIYLAKEFGYKDLCLVEKESSLLTHASYNNQARVHNGYHYPRSFTTAFRSRINLPQFVRDWPAAIKKDFTKLYAVPKRNSKVTPKQFEMFCSQIDARLEPANGNLKSLFNSHLIEDVYLVEEYAFDSTKLAEWAVYEIDKFNINVLLGHEAKSIVMRPNNLCVKAVDVNNNDAELNAKYVFNCTYSGINHIGGDFPRLQMAIKQEITEMPLVEMPEALRNLGITVMDGPFFSIMPFPARGLHTVSHVRYTPHVSWMDSMQINPYSKLNTYDKSSRFDRMRRDIERYIPAIDGAVQKDSLFEVKTVLAKNESDDGRPILFEKHHTLPGCFSILGGKIDNIYDILERIKLEIK